MYDGSDRSIPVPPPAEARVVRRRPRRLRRPGWDTALGHVGCAVLSVCLSVCLEAARHGCAAAGRRCRGLDVDEAPAGRKHHTVQFLFTPRHPRDTLETHHGAAPQTKSAAAKDPRSSRLLALPFSWPLARLDRRGLRAGLLPRTKPSRWARGIPVAQSL